MAAAAVESLPTDVQELVEDLRSRELPLPEADLLRYADSAPGLMLRNRTHPFIHLLRSIHPLREEIARAPCPLPGYHIQ